MIRETIPRVDSWTLGVRLVAGVTIAMNPSTQNDGGSPPLSWAALVGRWHFEGDQADYLEGQGWGTVDGCSVVGGLAVSSLSMRDGTVSVNLVFSEFVHDDPRGAGIALGNLSGGGRYVFAQLGTRDADYSIGEFTPGRGWKPLRVAGAMSNLEANCDYRIEVLVLGQRICLSVNGVRILEHEYLDLVPLSGGQVGLIAAGKKKVAFSDLKVKGERARVFVAMQFGEPFDTIYKEVIKKEEESDLKVEVVRSDELAGPGIIFEDIKRQIAEAQVVIAEITAPNPNVFYELGYAHALNKPTILLAQRGMELPFDIRSYRVIFYDDSIGGKPEVERNLHKHLLAVLQER